MDMRRGTVRTLWGLERHHMTWVVTHEQTHTFIRLWWLHMLYCMRIMLLKTCDLMKEPPYAFSFPPAYEEKLLMGAQSPAPGPRRLAVSYASPS